MLVELSPAVYMAILGVVRDTLEIDSDASPLMRRALNELSGVTAGGMIPAELAEQPSHLVALRRVGLLAQ